MIRTVVTTVVTIAALTAPALTLPAHTEQLTVRQCYDAYNGLLSLEKKVVTDERTGQQRIEPTNYKLDDAFWPIARDMTILRPLAETVERGRAQIEVDVSTTTNARGEKVHQSIMPGTPEAVDREARVVKLMDQPCGLAAESLLKFPLSALHVGSGKDQNNIPPSVISVLAPLLQMDLPRVEDKK